MFWPKNGWKVVKNEVFWTLTKIDDIYGCFVWSVLKTELFRIFLRRPHRKILKNVISSYFWTFFREFLENFRLKMADFLTFKKHSHVIYQFYCKLGADYENLKIFHFWPLLVHFWAKNGPNFEKTVNFWLLRNIVMSYINFIPNSVLITKI